MLFAARSHIGLVRQVNQDSYAVCTDLSPWQLLVVADGMGGASAGEVASKMAAETVVEVIETQLQEGVTDAAALLQNAVQVANTRIWQKSLDVREYIGMGTTLVAAMYNEQTVVFTHVGDSRGYIYRAGGLTQVTMDHSLVAELVRRGQLTEEEAQNHPQRNIVTRSLGTAESCEPEIDTVRWQPGDILFLCTDGLSNLVGTAELSAHLEPLQNAASNREAEKAADGLIRLALERGGPDNVTLVLAVHRERSGNR